jgi:type IV pilus assembly protein PilM
MPRSLIGLDVGTSAVRAAEVRLGRTKPVLVRFGQVALPVGAVEGGEVVDAAAVAAAIKRLWREAGFKGRVVTASVGGPRVVARFTDLPALSDDDLRSSLSFQVGDLIPIPLEEAVLDHQILGPAEALDGVERVRVLVVAAHRDLVRSLLTAVEGAGLSVDRLDVAPLALVRALAGDSFDDLADGATGPRAEAIVDVGAGVTNVVVHDRGIPSFIRALPTGGHELTEAVATDLDVEHAEAESLKRHTGVGEQAAQARQVVAAAVIPALEEIRGSLDYWQAQAGDVELRHVLLTGGGSRSADLAGRLHTLTGVEVLPARPFDKLDVEPAALAPEQIEAANDVASVAIGLALSADALAGGGRRISLLPTEIGVARRERRQTLAVAGAVAVFALLLLALYGLRAGRLHDEETKADGAEARTQQLTTQINQLHDVEALQADITTRRQTVATALAGDVAWTRLIQEVAAVLPNDVWLTSFTGSRGTLTSPGTVAFAATGFDHTSTAHWLIRTGRLPSINGLWVPSSAKSKAASGHDIVTFSSTAQLTSAAQSNRLAQYGSDKK